MANLFNGDYTITDDNGDLEIKGPNDNVILRHNETNDEWEFVVSITSVDISDLVDSSSSNTVYDSSAEELGDGNQDADLNALLSSLQILDLVDSNSGNTVYDEANETLGDGNQSANLNDLTSSLQILDLVDSNSGNTVYDESTETVGDGTQSLNVSGGSVDGDELAGFPSTVNNISPGFGSWTTADANRPALVYLGLQVQTDGSSNAKISVEVDESGGTSSDYQYEVTISSDASAGTTVEQQLNVYVPAGGQYQITNSSDPNSNNAIALARQVTF